MTQTLTNYHPRLDNWSEHFCIIGAQLIPLTPTGRVTVKLLQLNRAERVEERQLLILAKLLPI